MANDHVIPLVNVHLSRKASTKTMRITNFQRKFFLPLVVGLVLLFSIFSICEKNAKHGIHMEHVVEKKKSSNLVSKASQQELNDQNKNATRASDTLANSIPLSPDLASIDIMLQRFEQASQQLEAKLKVDYGPENYQNMFQERIVDHQTNQTTTLVSRGGYWFASPNGTVGPSWERFRNKLMQKILQVQIVAAASSETATDSSIPFVWATGGHSAAAGHGNLYNESYTAVMEQVVRPVFQAVGIQFRGRNYAMGGTSSSPEIASCVDAIFGQDMDVLSWDYGMTDGRDYAAMEYYFYRAARLKSRPACFALHVGGRGSGGRVDAMRELEERGLTAFYMNETTSKAITAAVPDTFGLKESDIMKMPTHVRAFKCGKQLENGDPGCGPYKYNLNVCPSRKFKAKWHPGWKYHAMIGHMNAVFLIEQLYYALQEVKARATDEQKLLTDLKAKEDLNYQQFVQSDVPEQAKSLLEVSATDIDISTIMKSPNFCHTARLPAEIRHKGILTESDMIGFTAFDMGTSKANADKKAQEQELMRLVYDSDIRQKCEVPLQMDYKDYFYVKQQEGWKKLILPNDAELKEYGTGEATKGVIATCLLACGWRKCPEGNLLEADIEAGLGEIEVNRIKVTNFTRFGGCAFLKNDQGHKWTANNEGRYEIRARPIQDSSFFRFSSFVLW